ncbi:hypothetical protein [Alcaligenes aquatilis]|uniref:Uncharacterized protein n=1 Tax=Alcaligenes aquatilis TaxID=323284 RepID=A0A3G2HSJ5_9BURK|nr:hypothetical protein [Alcaligenes aquatilis]AYN20103.1 hypothetical protein D3M96_05905 [Alcaligenes aquatilis]
MTQPDFELFVQVDGDGFVALVCPNAYSGYVGDDWTLAQITGRFLEQMNAQTLFVAHPGADLACEPLRISNRLSPIAANREASNILLVGNDGLWLTDYTQLTMAAQFHDARPIADHHTHVPVSTGNYRVTLRQLAAPPLTELIITETDSLHRQGGFSAIPWLG